MLGATLIDFFVPAWEGGEEDEADEGEDDGNDSNKKMVLAIVFPLKACRHSGRKNSH